MRMQHEQLTPLSPERLAECADKIPAGYPDAKDKLQLTPKQWTEIAKNGFVMPRGPWTLDNHRRQQDAGVADVQPVYTAENPASQQDIMRWQRAGLRIDRESKSLE
jgi:hypothetical protein